MWRTGLAATCTGRGCPCALAASNATAPSNCTAHAPLQLLANTYLRFQTKQHIAAAPPLCAQQSQPGCIGAGTPAGLATAQTAHCAWLQLLCSWPARGVLHVLTRELYGPAAPAASLCAPAGHTARFLSNGPARSQRATHGCVKAAAALHTSAAAMALLLKHVHYSCRSRVRAMVKMASDRIWLHWSCLQNFLALALLQGVSM
jgi:hypothetical protein